MPSASGGGTKNNTTATTVQTPQVPGWLQTPYQNLATAADTFINMPSSNFTTPESALQTQAFQRAGNPASSVNPSAYQAYTPQQVQAGQLAGTDLTPYTNPFQSQVIDQALADIDRVRQGEIAQNNASATKANAWGGSRHGVVDAGTNEAALRSSASTSAALRAQGYADAQRLAQGDIDRRYQADVFNEGQRFNASQYNLNAENMRANNYRADTEQMAQLGGQQRDIAQQNNPYVSWLSQLGAYAQLLGNIPVNAFTGQTQTQTGSGTSNSERGWLGYIGQMIKPLSGGVNYGGGGG